MIANILSYVQRNVTLFYIEIYLSHISESSYPSYILCIKILNFVVKEIQFCVQLLKHYASAFYSSENSSMIHQNEVHHHYNPSSCHGIQCR